MSSLRMHLGKRFKSLRNSMGSSPDGLLSTSDSEGSFTSFPIDPYTKAPLRVSPYSELACSPSWKLIVALNQSDEEPEMADESKLREFVRRSIHDDAHTRDLPPYDNIAILTKHHHAFPASASTSIRAGNSGLPLKVPPFTERDSARPSRSRRLSHRISFSALSNRCSWFKPSAGGLAVSHKHNYSRMQSSPEGTDEE